MVRSDVVENAVVLLRPAPAGAVVLPLLIDVPGRYEWVEPGGATLLALGGFDGTGHLLGFARVLWLDEGVVAHLASNVLRRCERLA